MKVKIGDVIYDGELQPVMVILTKEDKENIASMDDEHSKYCQYPEGSDVQKISEWMKT